MTPATRDGAIDAVISLTAYHASVPVRRLLSQRRVASWLTDVRTALVWLISESCGASYREIARHLGDLNYWSIAPIMRRAREKRRTDITFRQLTDRVLADLIEEAA